jgi:glutathionylspermidine synthase
MRWKEEVHPKNGQCNFIDKALISSFNSIKEKLGISFLGILCVEADRESKGTAEYLKKILTKSKLKDVLIDDISHLGFTYDAGMN